MKDKIYYVGMDVHMATTVIVAINAVGKQIMQAIVETKASSLLDAIRALRGEVHVTFEEGTHSNWLYDIVKPYVAEVVVCNPRNNKLVQSGNKTDEIDAGKLAELLRLGALKAVYHGEQAIKPLKELAHCYQNLVSDQTRVKNRLKALFRARAISYKGDQLYKVERRNEWIEQLQEEGARNRAEHLYEELDCLVKLCARAQRAMCEQARKQSAYKLLDSVPTLGPVRVALILAAMATPHRFRTKRQLWAYAGFAVINKSTADYAIVNGRIVKSKKFAATRGLNDNYNRTLKMVFKTAAAGVRSGLFKNYYDKLLEKGMSSQMARLTLARKIAAIALALWKKGECFETEKFLKQIS